MTDSPHHNVNPETLLAPVGFSHATVAAPGRTIYLGGQTGHRTDGTIDGELIPQFGQALDNVVTVLASCDAGPEHLVSVAIYTTDVAAYRAATRELGQVWQQRFGKHYPAMALFGIAELYDPRAVVEVVAVAVVPEG